MKSVHDFPGDSPGGQPHTTARELLMFDNEPTKVGQIALYDPARAQDYTSYPEMEREAQNEMKAEEAIRKVLEPYDHLFAPYVPTVDTNPRNWRGKVIPQKLSTNWKIPRSYGPVSYDFNYNLAYSAGKEKNTANSALIDIGQTHKFVPGERVKVNIGLKNDRFTAFGIRKPTQSSVYNLISQTDAPELRNCDFVEFKTMEGTVPSMRLIFGERFHSYGSNKDHDSTFTFDAATNVFKEQAYGDKPCLKSSYSLEEYTSLLSGALTILPIVDI